MLKLLRSLLTSEPPSEPSPSRSAPSLPTDAVSAPGARDFALREHLTSPDGLPVLDWEAVRQWVDGLADDNTKVQAWLACQRGWLDHLRAALGPGFHLSEARDAMLLSSLKDGQTRAMLEYVSTTVRRVVALLDGIALDPHGKEILIVFDDEDSYYQYVSHAYADGGHFAGSSGMYIHAGCPHFVTVRNDLHAIEPVIAHELTHSCVAHLPIPAWLNEGTAVNAEQRLCPGAANARPASQMHARHRAFWGRNEIQEFWSGKSFLRPDHGNELSYDLARIIVAHYATDWPLFRAFVLDASIDDAGANAARHHLGVDLGDVVAALLEQPSAAGWSPDPTAWADAPERGAFRHA